MQRAIFLAARLSDGPRPACAGRRLAIEGAADLDPNHGEKRESDGGVANVS
jgi:hypothetical protein